MSWSFFGYAVIFLVVLLVLVRLWEARAIILTLLVFGTIAYFVTNRIVKNRDMSDDNVKKTTISVTTKSLKKIIEFCDGVDEYNARREKEFNERYNPVSKRPKPESEGFVVE